MEHLALEIYDLEQAGATKVTGSKFANLNEDASITITDTSEIFGSGDAWSHNFTLNVYANAHIFGTSGEIHGSRLHELINNRRARIWAEGLPLFLGYLKLDSEAEVDENGDVDITFESGQKTFDEMIEGAKANQVPMIGNVQFGMAFWRKRFTAVGLKLSAYAVMSNGDKTTSATVMYGDEQAAPFIGDGELTPVQQYPRMVFPKGKFFDEASDSVVEKNFLNTDLPYLENENGVPSNPYCNVALCYQKHGWPETESGSIDYSGEQVALRGYDVMPANRVNSAPNFFVLYWLRALFTYLGIHIDENDLYQIQDMRRLFFVNTKCAYEEPEYLRHGDVSAKYGRYQFTSALKRYISEQIVPKDNVKVQESSLKAKDVTATQQGSYPPSYTPPTVDRVVINVESVLNWGANAQDPDLSPERAYLAKNNYLHNAYATSDCFPDVEIKKVIEMLESAFGVRFLFDADYKRVRIVLLRNIFNRRDIQHLSCDILNNDVKKENNIRGFRMTYGDNDDSHFYYKGFADLLLHKQGLWADKSDSHDYSQWSLNADYASIINKVSAFDVTCYVTPNTGNAYGIKIDKNAKRYDELHPSVFEFAGFMDAEDGDCTGDEETIKTINAGFVPAIMNDVNFEDERSNHTSQQQFALFVDEEMRPRRYDLGLLESGKSYNDSDSVYDIGEMQKHNELKSGGIVKPGEFAITSDMYAYVSGLHTQVLHGVSLGTHMNTSVPYELSFNAEGYINEGYRLYLQDNYEPNDDGVSPIEKKDWGLTLGIMRGSGSDAYVDYSFDPDDGEGNDTWDIMAGSSVTAHPDTCDSYGSEWDYNGTSVIGSPDAAIAVMSSEWPDSNFDLANRTASDYLTEYFYLPTQAEGGQFVGLLFACQTNDNSLIPTILLSYMHQFKHKSIADMYRIDKQRYNLLIEVDSSRERGETLLCLQRIAFAGSHERLKITNGIGSHFGRFSLKLRAEKLNPYFNPKQAESENNRRYLQITNPDLRGRGLADQFYKEYSYWIRNARILERTVKMELAQLLSIDKTVRVTVGDVTGFILKMQYTISKKTGLGSVTLEIMYI